MWTLNFFFFKSTASLLYFFVTEYFFTPSWVPYMWSFSPSASSHTIFSLHNQTAPLLQHAQESFLKSSKVNVSAAAAVPAWVGERLPLDFRNLCICFAESRAPQILWYLYWSEQRAWLHPVTHVPRLLSHTHTRALHGVLISQRGERSESACGPLEGATLAFQELCVIFRPVALNYCKSAAP